MLTRSGRALSRATCLAILSAALLAVPARAHFGGEAYILVSADHVNPGEPFEVIVADLAPGSSVVIEARREGESVEVGRTVSGTEGHFSTSATLPAGYPNGYTELVATAQDGTQVSTYVLVGPRDATTGPPPATNSGSRGPDPSLIVLGVLVAGSIGAVGYTLLRRRSAPASAAPAAATQRRAVARKRPRRRST